MLKLIALFISHSPIAKIGCEKKTVRVSIGKYNRRNQQNCKNCLDSSQFSMTFFIHIFLREFLFRIYTNENHIFNKFVDNQLLPFSNQQMATGNTDIKKCYANTKKNSFFLFIHQLNYNFHFSSLFSHPFR